MSRRNPTTGAKNPSTRWFTWAGGGDQGYIEWYDRDAKVNVKVPGAFTFLLLDELSSVKGWHEPSESSIYANEVRDTRQEVLVVRSHKGGELASGLYQDIKDKIIAKGGHYHASIYIAFKDAEGAMKLGNLGLKGAALSAWMEFKKSAGKKINEQAVVITGFSDERKGGTAYRVPKFALKEVSAATNEQALVVDDELSAYLSEYLKRPKSEAAKPAGNGFEEEPPFQPDEQEPAFADDDIPY